MRQTQQMRGQAFVVFRSQQQADVALETLNAFNIFGKDMVSRPRLTCVLGAALCEEHERRDPTAAVHNERALS